MLSVAGQYWTSKSGALSGETRGNRLQMGCWGSQEGYSKDVVFAGYASASFAYASSTGSLGSVPKLAGSKGRLPGSVMLHTRACVS